MGQYYRPTIIDSRNHIHFVHPHEYDNGLKLLEHSYIGNDVVGAVLLQIYRKPQRIAWVGDYACDDYSGKEPYQKKDKRKFRIFWNRVYGEDSKRRKIHPQPLEGFGDLPNFNGWYLVNHTRRAYVDLSSYMERNKWHEEYDWRGEHYSYDMCISPLPLLTACGNNRGGGDYYDSHPDFDKVGTWAFDLIEFTDTIQEGYEKVDCHFTEEESIE